MSISENGKVGKILYKFHFFYFLCAKVQKTWVNWLHRFVLFSQNDEIIEISMK